MCIYVPSCPILSQGNWSQPRGRREPYRPKILGGSWLMKWSLDCAGACVAPRKPEGVDPRVSGMQCVAWKGVISVSDPLIL